MRLDSLTRIHLWNMGLDYRHGTGHGVGHILSVMEGPQCIAHRGERAATEGLKENMVMTLGMVP